MYGILYCGYIFLMNNEVKHLLMYFLAIWISSVVKSLLNPLTPFSLGSSVSLLFVEVYHETFWPLHMFQIDPPTQWFDFSLS